jgi:hypothetical protein
MDLGAEAAATPPQCLGFLPTVFLPPQPHTGARAPRCCRASHSPYPGPRQNGPSSVPTRRGRTIAQSVCRRCSSCHTRRATTATAHRSAAPTTPLPRSGDTCLRAQRILEGIPVGMPRLLSIDRHVRLFSS